MFIYSMVLAINFKFVTILLKYMFGCRVTKENRAAGVLDNFEEGEKYAQHGVRKFLRTQTPEIMPKLNKFFSNPN